MYNHFRSWHNEAYEAIRGEFKKYRKIRYLKEEGVKLIHISGDFDKMVKNKLELDILSGNSLFKE